MFAVVVYTLSVFFFWLHAFHSSCRFQISTLATRLGVRNIAFLGSGLLLANYLGAILVAIYMPQVNIFLFEPFIVGSDFSLIYLIDLVPNIGMVFLQVV